MAETEPTSFSSSGADAISRPLELGHEISKVPNPITLEELALVEELYEVQRTANEIVKGGYKQVALQFPDELLHISVPIYRSIKRRIEGDIGLYVLADTSYGSCCVDEVAAQHIDADVIVHYGYSCLSRPSRIPVLYVFSKAQLDVKDAADSLLKSACEGSPTTQTPNFILIPDVAYVHVSDELLAALRSSPLLPLDSQIFYDPAPSHSDPSKTSPSLLASHVSPIPSGASGSVPRDSGFATTPSSHPHRRYTLPASVSLSSCTILYVGPESLGLTNLLMTHPDNRIISYDPTSPSPTTKVESARSNKLLMRRYAVVQRARDADVFGILVATLGVASYLPLITHLRSLLRKRNKKSYTLSVGKLNPSKLANFAEIECFVLVACPENSVINAKEFLRPIVTPFELSLALSSEPSWPGNYILDFEHLIQHQIQTDSNDAADESDTDRPTFSLVTGKYRQAKRYAEETPPSTSGDSSDIMLRNTNNALTSLSISAGAEFLQQRTFKGLEQRLDKDEPSVLERGRSGIAREYQDDHSPPAALPE